MDMIQIVIFALTSSLLYLVLKDVQENIAFLIAMLTSIVILFFIVEQIKAVILYFEQLALQASIQRFYLDTIFKIIGISYIIEISSNLIKDAGLSSLASKLELVGKIFILLLALPIIQAVIDTILEFLPVGLN